MLRYTISRILLTIPTLLGVAVLVFFMLRIVPGGPGNPTTSFRGGSQSRTRNLEIPRCAIAHLRSGACAPSRNDEPIVAAILGLWTARPADG